MKEKTINQHRLHYSAHGVVEIRKKPRSSSFLFVAHVYV